MLKPPAVKLLAIILLASALVLRAMAWVLDSAGRWLGLGAVPQGPQHEVRRERSVSKILPAPTHFHVQRYCSYCGVVANLNARCDGCGSPPLSTDTIVKFTINSPQAKEHHHG